MKSYPTSTANKNVPASVLLLAETSSMSGEIVTTYYIDRDGNMLKVADWKGDKPSPVFFNQLYKLIGDTPNMIEARWKSHYQSA